MEKSSYYAGMSMSPTLFRFVLSSSIAISLLGSFIDLMFPPLVPEAVSQARVAYDTELSTPTVIFLGFVFLILVGGGIAAFVGLFIFRPWAPGLAVATTAISLLAWPALEANVYSGWAVALTQLSTTLWGVVLAAAYFSPIKERFAASRKPGVQSDAER